MKVTGIIFDLDGTLIESGLDFEQMRREMGLPRELPILEALRTLPGWWAARCRQILDWHEWAGCRRATAMPGLNQFLESLHRRGCKLAVLTRNSRSVAQATLDRLELSFDLLLAREDAAAKPDPDGIWQICRQWGLPPAAVAMMGDFRFDIEAGHRAGSRTVLYLGQRTEDEVADYPPADYRLTSFHDFEPFLTWLDNGSAPA